jgi:two-component system, NarL family, response regulator NreC
MDEKTLMTQIQRNTTVFLIVDNAVTREGLGVLLKNETYVEIVGSAPIGQDAVQQVLTACPDVVVLDVTRIGVAGMNILRNIHEQCPSTYTMVLSKYVSFEDIVCFLNAGAKAYVSEETVDVEIADAIRTIRAGQRYLSSKISNALLDKYMQMDSWVQSRDPLMSLSMREREVLQLVAEGKTTAYIASVLNLSPKTVSTYRCRAMEKLGIRNITELVKFAIKNGMTPLSYSHESGYEDVL